LKIALTEYISRLSSLGPPCRLCCVSQLRLQPRPTYPDRAGHLHFDERNGFKSGSVAVRQRTGEKNDFERKQSQEFHERLHERAGKFDFESGEWVGCTIAGRCRHRGRR
jgi:hypothetical protein